ncbi:MAG: DNA primase [Elusimicrobiota bacterium]
MGRIAESSREEVRDKTDIAELVREYVPSLKQAGRTFKACCPFHQEKTPSFTVNPERQIYHCFGCHEGGDIFSFVMKVEGLSFPEALEKLAERAGVKLEKQTRELTAGERERVSVKKALEFAREYYHELLRKSDSAGAARGYFTRRGLSKETVIGFRLGFAPKAGGFLAEAAKKGFGREVLLKAGLAAERAGRTRDYFWDRVLFPIENARGETVGFGARTMGDGQPKYLNSPETVMFSKRRVLYGLDRALPSMRKVRRAVILEGYMDVLAAQQFGFTNTCAPLGTALTAEHAEFFHKRGIHNVTMVFDPDTAGSEAALRGAEHLLSENIKFRIASLPGNMDPDELLNEKGKEAFQEALDGASDLPIFKLERMLAARPADSAERKSEIANEILGTIDKMPDEVLKSEWRRVLAQRIGIDEASLYRQLSKGRPANAGPARRRHGGPRAEAAPSPLPILERDILLYLFRAPSLAVDDELVAESDFSDARAKAIFLAMRKVLSEGEAKDWSARLLDVLAGEQAALARSVLIDERTTADPAKVLARLVGRMRKQRRLNELEPLVTRGGVDCEIHEEYVRLLSELKGTGKGE